MAFAGTALTADLAVVPPPVPLFTWTGPYLGGQIGYAWSNDSADFDEFVPATPPRGRVRGTPAIFLFEPVGLNPRGVIGGGHAGYNLQIDQWVAGIEVSLDGTSLGRTTFLPLIPSSITETTRSNVQASVRGRIGWAFDRALIYATGGVAFTDLVNSFDDTTGVFTGTPGLTTTISTPRAGWTVGAGAEYALTNNWSVRAEYRYSDFGHASLLLISTTSAGVTAQHHLTENQVQAGFSYKFDLLPPVIAKY